VIYIKIIFTNPGFLWFLLGLPLVVVVHFFGWVRSRNKGLLLANFEAIGVSVGDFISKDFLLLFFKVVIFLCLVFVGAGMNFGYSGEASGFDFVLAIDISSSMLADDYKPSRLNVAKEAAISFVDNVGGGKIGVVSFSGSSFVKLLPTSDFSKVKEVINELEVIPVGGTDLGEAIIMSTNLLLMEDGDKRIVLLTDGQDNIGAPIEEALKYVSGRVIIDTIGVGSEEGGRVEGLEAVLTLNEENLKKISSETGGKYYKAENKNELISSFNEIVSDNKRVVLRDMSYFLVIVCLVLLFVYWMLTSWKYNIVK